MRYHYEKPVIYSTMYGETYECDHLIYDSCTLYKMEDRGLSVIQQRFNNKLKVTYWTEIDPWLTDVIYLHPGFRAIFEERSGIPKNDIYPTITIRQLMWALKMKPLKREPWETCFDRKDI